MRTIKIAVFLVAGMIGAALVVPVLAQQNFWTLVDGVPRITSSLLFSPDNTYAIGASGATRPSNVFIANTMATATANANLLELNAVAFASLGTPSNGTFRYCSDCTIASPCAGSGTGSFAKRLNGVWVCN